MKPDADLGLLACKAGTLHGACVSYSPEFSREASSINKMGNKTLDDLSDISNTLYKLNYISDVVGTKITML